MKNMILGLGIILIVLVGIVFVMGIKLGQEDIYKNLPQTDTTVQSDDKYVVYIYSENDLYSEKLKADIATFSELAIQNGIGFYLINADDSNNKDIFIEMDPAEAQSGTDYPVTPEQANELGLENFKIAGTPSMIYVENGVVKNVGTGVQTSEMGNSYVSVQDTMEAIAESNGFAFEAVYAGQ